MYFVHIQDTADYGKYTESLNQIIACNISEMQTMKYT